MKPFAVSVADLVHRPASRRHELLRAPAGEALQVAETVVDPATEIAVDVLLEAVSDGVLAKGTITTGWEAICRRCLQPAHGRVELAFRELFTHDPLEGETYPIRHEQVDLELVAREAILLDLPLAPLCREECRGLCPTCGADLNSATCSCVAAVTDPRWAALDELRSHLEDLTEP